MRHASFVLVLGLRSMLPGLLAVLLLGGCATPPKSLEAQQLWDGALDLWLEREARLHRVGQRVSAAASDLCPANQTPVLGMVVVRGDSIWSFMEDPAARRFENGGDMVVVETLPGFPAAAAGVHPGDVILEIAGSRVTRPAQVYWTRRMRPGPVSVKLLRDGQPIEQQLEWRAGCDVHVNLQPMQLANAFARTRRRPRLGERPFIAVTYGMIRRLTRDKELAFVIGHEFAHTVLLRGAGLALTGQEQEKSADYVGAHLAVLAGYELTPNDYEIIALSAYANPALELADDEQRSHPTSAERELAFRRTLEEIEAKAANGESLVPEIKR